MSSINVTENFVAHLAIQDLLNRYTNAVNQRNAADLRELMTEDADWVLESPETDSPQLSFNGSRQIAEGIIGALSSAKMSVQMNHAPVIEVKGKQAYACSTINEIIIHADGSGFFMLGTYHDDIRSCPDGEWRFQSRRFRMTYVDNSPLAGQVMEKFPRISQKQPRD